MTFSNKKSQVVILSLCNNRNQTFHSYHSFVLYLGSVPSDAASDLFLTHVEAAKLLNTLLKLRQACCHPQVGSSGLRSLHQSPMTMDEILSVGFYEYVLGHITTFSLEFFFSNLLISVKWDLYCRFLWARPR